MTICLAPRRRLRRWSPSLTIHLPGLRSSAHSRIPFPGKKQDDKNAAGRIPGTSMSVVVAMDAVLSLGLSRDWCLSRLSRSRHLSTFGFEQPSQFGPESSRARIVPDQSTSNGPSPIEQHPSQALLDLMNLLAVCRKAVTESCDLLVRALFFRLKRRLSILECLDSLCMHLDLLVCQGQCCSCSRSVHSRAELPFRLKETLDVLECLKMIRFHGIRFDPQPRPVFPRTWSVHSRRTVSRASRFVSRSAQ